MQNLNRSKLNVKSMNQSDKHNPKTVDEAVDLLAEHSLESWFCYRNTSERLWVKVQDTSVLMIVK